jgi:hypothetical protein
MFAAAAAFETEAPGFVVRLPVARILVMLLVVFHVFSEQLKYSCDISA